MTKIKTLKKYCEEQKKVIELDKYLEGCRLKKDPGESFIFEWIRVNAKKFRGNFIRKALTKAHKELKLCIDNGKTNGNKPIIEQCIEEIEDCLELMPED
jgi:hypothetical protein